MTLALTHQILAHLEKNTNFFSFMGLLIYLSFDSYILPGLKSRGRAFFLKVSQM